MYAPRRGEITRPVSMAKPHGCQRQSHQLSGCAALIDQWLAEHYQEPEDIRGREGLLKLATMPVVERALTAELTHPLGQFLVATSGGRRGVRQCDDALHSIQHLRMWPEPLEELRFLAVSFGLPRGCFIGNLLGPVAELRILFRKTISFSLAHL